MKNVYDNYGVAREAIQKEREAKWKLFEYAARNRDNELDLIVRNIIATTGTADGDLIYCASELDKCEYILYKLKKIPVLGFIIRKMEEAY